VNIHHQYPSFPFPEEVSLMVLSYLGGKELLQCCPVSKKVKALAEDNALWKDIAFKEQIPFSSHLPVKQQVKAYCFRFTQLFCSIFPQDALPPNWFERYSVMKAFVESSKEQPHQAEIIQKTLDNCIETASIETTHVSEKIGMLLQAGGNFNAFLYSPIYVVINKIKAYAVRDSDLYKRFRFASQSPLSVTERQDFMQLLHVLEAFIEGNGTIGRSDDHLPLAKTALKYKCYKLAKGLIVHHIRNTLGKETLEQLLFSIVEKGGSYSTEELPHIKEIIEILLKAGARTSSNFVEKLDEMGIDAKSLNCGNNSTAMAAA
jgi:hypothetical protein